MSKQLPLSLYVFIILFSCEKTHLFKGPLIGLKVIFFRSRRNPFSKNNVLPILNIILLLYMRFTKLDVNTNILKTEISSISDTGDDSRGWSVRLVWYLNSLCSLRGHAWTHFPRLKDHGRTVNRQLSLRRVPQECMILSLLFTPVKYWNSYQIQRNTLQVSCIINQKTLMNLPHL